MYDALTLTRFEAAVRQVFEGSGSGVVMILVARYQLEIVQKLFRENYEYWTQTAGKAVSIFLAGYGENLPQGKYRKLVDGTPLYFDAYSFGTFKTHLYDKMGLTYDDKVELFLVDCVHGKVQYSGALRIDIGSSAGENHEEIRRLMAFLIEAARKFSSVKEIQNRYRLRKARNLAKMQVRRLAEEGVSKIVFSVLP